MSRILVILGMLFSYSAAMGVDVPGPVSIDADTIYLDNDCWIRDVDLVGSGAAAGWSNELHGSAEFRVVCSTPDGLAIEYVTGYGAVEADYDKDSKTWFVDETPIARRTGIFSVELLPEWQAEIEWEHGWDTISWSGQFLWVE